MALVDAFRDSSGLDGINIKNTASAGRFPRKGRSISLPVAPKVTLRLRKGGFRICVSRDGATFDDTTLSIEQRPIKELRDIVE